MSSRSTHLSLQLHSVSVLVVACLAEFPCGTGSLVEGVCMMILMWTTVNDIFRTTRRQSGETGTLADKLSPTNHVRCRDAQWSGSSETPHHGSVFATSAWLLAPSGFIC